MTPEPQRHRRRAHERDRALLLLMLLLRLVLTQKKLLPLLLLQLLLHPPGPQRLRWPLLHAHHAQWQVERAPFSWLCTPHGHQHRRRRDLSSRDTERIL